MAMLDKTSEKKKPVDKDFCERGGFMCLLIGIMAVVFAIVLWVKT